MRGRYPAPTQRTISSELCAKTDPPLKMRNRCVMSEFLSNKIRRLQSQCPVTVGVVGVERSTLVVSIAGEEGQRRYITARNSLIILSGRVRTKGECVRMNSEI